MICAVLLLSSYFGYFQKEAYFLSTRLGTRVYFCPFLWMCLGIFTFACEYEVFAFTKLLREISSLPPSSFLPSCSFP